MNATSTHTTNHTGQISHTSEVAIPTGQQVLISLRLVLVSMLICCGAYTLLIWGIGQALVPHTANGALIYNDQGQIIGSQAIAQAFTRPEYLWPRPSAPDYDASATGGSNWSPTNPALRERAQKSLSQLNVAESTPVPADLVTASGSGMDPHITLKAAKYQLPRIAQARGVPIATLEALLQQHTETTGGFLNNEPLINVLRVNLALDKEAK